MDSLIIGTCVTGKVRSVEKNGETLIDIEHAGFNFDGIVEVNVIRGDKATASICARSEKNDSVKCVILRVDDGKLYINLVA